MALILGWLYAALKRRSFTVVLAMVVISVRSGKVEIKVKSVGQECPTHMGNVKSDGPECASQTIARVPADPLWRCLVRPAVVCGVRDPSTSHDVHFVGVMLRSG